MVTASNISTEHIWKILEEVTDPEVPVLTIIDLGIVRDVKINGDEVEIVITPTYTGCPAMDMIAMNIRLALIENGYSKIKINSVLGPAWHTDWKAVSKRRRLCFSFASASPRLSARITSASVVWCKNT